MHSNPLIRPFLGVLDAYEPSAAHVVLARPAGRANAPGSVWQLAWIGEGAAEENAPLWFPFRDGRLTRLSVFGLRAGLAPNTRTLILRPVEASRAWSPSGAAKIWSSAGAQRVVVRGELWRDVVAAAEQLNSGVELACLPPRRA